MQQITKIDLPESLKMNTLIYSRETFDRAFGLGGPAGSDGLKPIHRRILYSLWENNTYQFTKVATCQGRVLQYHPHGDSSVYGALVRMAQPWVTNYPYIEIQGNLGGQDGTVSASARYIECRLTPFAKDVVLDELDKVTVDFEDNFDFKSMVPKYLPSKIPLILVNGVQGIGVGFKCDFPPHNLADIADRCITYIKNKTISNEMICDGLFPDFPTGGEILNGKELESFYKYGTRATVDIRGKHEFDTNTNTIILTEFPYGVPIDDIAVDIQNQIEGGNMILSGIIEYQDNNHNEENKSSGKKRKATTYEYKCKKEANMMEILNEMSKISGFRTTIQMNFMVNIDGYPKYVSVLDIIKDWYQVRIDCIRRRHLRNISLAQEKLHLYEGILSIYPIKKDVIKFLSDNKGTSKEEIIEELHKTFKITKTQARGIYEMPLGTLSGFGEQDLRNRIDNLKKGMLDDDYVLTHMDAVIIAELEELKRKYGRPRKTTIIMDYQDTKSAAPVVSKGVFLYSHNSLGLFDINGAKNNKGLLNGMRAFKGFGKGVREINGGVGLEGSPKGFVVCYSDATIHTVESGVFRVLNVWYDTKCDEKDQARMITAACPYYGDDDEFVCLSDDYKVKRISVKDLSKRAVGSGSPIIKIARNDPNDERLDCLMVGSTSDKGPTYSVVPIDDIPMLGRSAGGVKCAYEKQDGLDVFISLIDIGSSDEMSRFFVGTCDAEGQGYIHSIPIYGLKITGRTNKPKLLGLPKDQKATGLFVGNIDPKNKDQIVSMIGKTTLTTLSVSNFKKEFSFKRLFLNAITGDIL